MLRLLSNSNFFLTLLLIPIISIFAVGCAVRPLPKNVTRKNTTEIAQRIRCEIRDAIRIRVVGLLKFYGYPNLARTINSGNRSYYEFLKFDVPNLEKTPRTLVERYSLAFVAYEFEFDITEENNLSGGIDFLDVLTRGTLKLGVSGKKDRKRQNKRNYKAIDNFAELISSPVMERVCSKKVNQSGRKKYMYPISGSLGLLEVVDTFLTLNQSGNLVGSIKGAEKIPTLSDTLTFTTTISGTLNPVIELNSVGSGPQLTGANLNKTSARTDIHKLILVLTLPEDGYKLTGRTVAQKRAQLERSALGELERQRVKAIDSDTELIRRNLLGQ